jgi:hypothetical protein
MIDSINYLFKTFLDYGQKTAEIFLAAPKNAFFLRQTKISLSSLLITLSQTLINY